MQAYFGQGNFFRKILKQRTYPSKISIFKKPAEILYLGGFWDEESRDENRFWK